LAHNVRPGCTWCQIIRPPHDLARIVCMGASFLDKNVIIPAS
jgi:hypothetical protein